MESKGDFKDDLVEGKWQWFYPGGGLKEEAYFKKGLNVGERIIFNQDGSINKKIIFKNNEAVDTLYIK